MLIIYFKIKIFKTNMSGISEMIFLNVYFGNKSIPLLYEKQQSKAECNAIERKN